MSIDGIGLSSCLRARSADLERVAERVLCEFDKSSKSGDEEWFGVKALYLGASDTVTPYPVLDP